VQERAYCVEIIFQIEQALGPDLGSGMLHEAEALVKRLFEEPSLAMNCLTKPGDCAPILRRPSGEPQSV
jgi:hypothetical protein